MSREYWPESRIVLSEGIDDSIIKRVEYHPEGMITFVVDEVLKSPPAGGASKENFAAQQEHLCEIARHIHAHSACLLQYVSETRRRWLSPRYIHPPDFLYRGPNSLGGNTDRGARDLPSRLTRNVSTLRTVFLDANELKEPHRRYAELVAQDGGVPLASLVLGALTSLSNSDFTRAVIDAWVGTEALVKIDFRDKYGRIDGTTNKQIEKLTSDGIYDSSTESLLTIARQGRNKWMHKFKPATLDQARAAVEIVSILFARRFGVQIPTEVSVIV